MFFRIVETDWETNRDELLEVRQRVFVEEQGVPEDVEIDGRDPECLHFLAFDAADRAIGAARLEASGKLGRMAVSREARGTGVGAALLAAALRAADARGLLVVLSAQESAVGFYERYGFVVDGPPFEEAGIPHRPMRRA
jgi:predicted GNAT family N-acyltransferase